MRRDSVAPGRRCSLRRSASLCAVFVGSWLVPHAHATDGSLSADVTAAAVPPPLRLRGHGNGHGIGMGQYGAFGAAVDLGWSRQQILDHYYGGTVAGSVPPEGQLSVRLKALDDRPTVIVSLNGSATLAGRPDLPASMSMVVKETSAGAYSVWGRADLALCADPAVDLAADAAWTLLGADIPGPVSVNVAQQPGSGDDIRALLAVCEPSGRARWYRGSIRAANGTDGENRTVNVVPTEQYLRSVVASEVPASWGAAGGGRGMQALEAQAVAARSYALRQSRYSYAKTCDTQACQVYNGVASALGPMGALRRHEFAATDAAVAATAGVVRRVGSATGPIASTMFSSSTGGYTKPTESPGYPAVADPGDATASNKYHNWTVEIPAATIEAAFPAVGQFIRLDVLQRNGLGQDGGRVVTARVVGAQGSVTLTGDDVRRRFGLRSDWFVVLNDPCGVQRQPAVTTRIQSMTAGFVPATPRRVADTINGLGVPKRPLAAGCWLTVALVPPTKAVAAVVTVHAAGREAAGQLVVYACGTPRPATTTVRLAARRLQSVYAVVPLAAARTLCVHTSTNADVMVDVVGWMVPGAVMGLSQVSPRRLVDTKVRGVKVMPGAPLRVSLSGVPAVGAAASISVVASGTSTDAVAVVTPCNDTASRLIGAGAVRVAAGGVRSGHGWVPSGDRRLCVTVSAPMHIAVDLHGWLTVRARPLSIRPPQRVVDTERRVGAAGRLRAGAPIRVRLGAPKTAIAFGLTVVSPARAGTVRVYPCAARVASSVATVATDGKTVAGFAATVLNEKGEVCVVASVDTDLVIEL